MATIDRSRTAAPRTIVIAGAGIGGLTAALALAEIGFHVVVAERSDHLSVVGAGIQIGPNASRVLATLGLEDAMAAAAIEPSATRSPQRRQRPRTGGNPRPGISRTLRRAYRVLHRADLQSVLVDAAAANPAIRLVLNATVPEFLVQDGGLLVRVQGAAGADVVPAEAIIGADGVWSALREKIAGTARPKPTGHTAWRALIAADDCRGLVGMDRVGVWIGRTLISSTTRLRRARR